MTKVEDIPRNMLSQDGNFPKLSSKSSMAARTITHVYMLALVVSVILAGLYFVNYTSSSEPFLAYGFSVPLMVHPDQDYSFYIAIDNRPMVSYLHPNASNGLVFAYRFDENHTYWSEGPPTGNTINHWQVESVHLLLTPSVAINFWRIIVSEEANGTLMNQNSQYIGLGPNMTGTDYFGITEVTQPSLYEYVVTNTDTVDMNDTLQIQIEWRWFDKPYFYYGVVGLLAGLLYPPIILAPRLLRKRHMPELAIATINMSADVSETIGSRALASNRV